MHSYKAQLTKTDNLVHQCKGRVWEYFLILTGKQVLQNGDHNLDMPGKYIQSKLDNPTINILTFVPHSKVNCLE